MKDLRLGDISSDFPGRDVRRFLQHQDQGLVIFSSIFDRTQFKNPQYPLSLLGYCPRHASNTLSFSPFWLSYLVCKPTDFRKQVHDQQYGGQVVALQEQPNVLTQQPTHVRTRTYFFFFKWLAA